MVETDEGIQLRRRLGHARRKVRRSRKKAQRVIRGAIGELTSDLRLRPEFIIFGAMKGGTTALFSYLDRHPDFALARKEIHYFDRHYQLGHRWYFGHFPVRALAGDAVTGEASPYYLFHPPAPARVRELLPDVRLIAILRDPVDRTLSHYHHKLAAGVEHVPFEEAITAESERLRGQDGWGDGAQTLSRRHFSYLARGRYAEQLEHWFGVFPREQFLILSSADLSSSPAAVVAEVCRFVGVEPREFGEYPRRHERRYPPMSPETREQLARYFEEPNRRLYELLGRDFGWSRPGTS